MIECFREYRCAEGRNYEAFVSSPQEVAAPTVLLLHHWAGQTSDTHDIARALSAIGFTVVALDVYGSGLRGTSPDQCLALMAPLMQHRHVLADRLRAGLSFARSQPEVDETRMVALGHCFGGLCALDIARLNLGVKGVISVHGVLTPPEAGATCETIGARVLVLHGDRDPMAPRAEELAFREEMTVRSAEWEVQIFGHAMHAFTWPGADLPDQGLQFHPMAAARSQKAIAQFLQECIGSPA
ncbi:hypothetical protein LYSHEL_21760 [Lysobacter helvus]|uniref:Dienelactone hydrolase domain-containing protein n=2 Tax=Lysobacteraceae TaxID=32033 RepID=A0ABM7Q6X4_9GAMM|nr:MULTISPECIES: dienelactone hydrolase family protein [Lysobacter]BCT93153.1 hypothetical protein LYSCAS_21770 [Lysobacter caseinilyticus]BCT96305.1 hypothetical protein LYSHEL_21760 [Lysobacter helvus]